MVDESVGLVEACVYLSAAINKRTEYSFSVQVFTYTSSGTLRVIIIIIFMMLMTPLIAARGDDYHSVNTHLMFPPGSGNGTALCVNVTIVDDDLIEGNEVFNVRLYYYYNDEGVGIGRTIQTSGVTIIDNDCKYCMRGPV